MKNKILYRDPIDGEIDLVIELLINHYKECRSDFLELPYFRKKNKNALKNNSDLKILVIDINDNIEGFLIYLHSNHPIYERKDIIIRDVYITKKYRKQNITSNCIDHLLISYKNHNFFVDLLFNDNRADNFWRKNKFYPYQKRYKLKNSSKT